MGSLGQYNLLTNTHGDQRQRKESKQINKHTGKETERGIAIYKQAHLQPKIDDETDVQRTKAQLHRNNYRKQNKTSK